jgi:hypothetical protein
MLTLTPLTSDQVEMKIVVTDGWAGYNGAVVTLNPFSITPINFTDIVTSVDEKVYMHEPIAFLYPNPAHSVLKLAAPSIELIQILGTEGKVYESFPNPGNEIDISSLRNGMYYVRAQINGVFYWQKIIKY